MSLLLCGWPSTQLILVGLQQVSVDHKGDGLLITKCYYFLCNLMFGEILILVFG